MTPMEHRVVADEDSHMMLAAGTAAQHVAPGRTTRTHDYARPQQLGAHRPRIDAVPLTERRQ